MRKETVVLRRKTAVESDKQVVIDHTVRGDPARTTSARTAWDLVQASVNSSHLRTSGPDSIVRCVLCGSIFRLGDAHVRPLGNIGSSDWSCIDRSCCGGLAAFVPASAPESVLRLA